MANEKSPDNRAPSGARSNEPGAQPNSPTGAKGVPLRPVTGTHVELRHLAKPATVVRKPRIHARKLLPLVRGGRERAFHTQPPPTLVRSLNRAAAPPDDLGTALNTQLLNPP